MPTPVTPVFHSSRTELISLESATEHISKRLALYGWLVLFYNLLVVMWGAYVRATGSGAGCGNHWPLCGGEVLPRSPQIATIIEFTHRLTSGVAFLFVLGLLIWVFRATSKKHIARTGAILSIVFMVLEALIGAGLVIFKLVAGDTSMTRAVYLSCHLVNTFLLLASIGLTAWWLSGGIRPQIRKSGLLGLILLIGIIATLVLGVSGAIAALGDTLFPVTSFSEGFKQDFSTTAHFLIRLRILHPIIAIIVGLFLIAISVLVSMIRPGVATNRLATLVAIIVLVQLMIGFINVWLLAPVWLQLFHLLLADLVWLALILLTASVFGAKVRSEFNL
ncbi:MAG: COX15/CtaA family protein [Pyrinomonadaceae bacterium]